MEFRENKDSIRHPCTKGVGWYIIWGEMEISLKIPYG